LAKRKPGLRWGVERRLEFVEFRLFWEGRVNRGDIVDKFGVSVTQASADINRYIALAPQNTAYDHRRRTFGRSAKFKSILLKPDASRYLAQLRSVGDGVIDRADAWTSQLPDYGSAPTPARGVNAEIVRAVAAAIRANEAIEVKYQSLSRPDPLWRWVTPHAFGFDGFRWHARAYCHLDGVFKDFLLSRVLQTRSTRTTEVDPECDHDWQRHVTLEIGPHPDLSDAQKHVIGLDYGMNSGKAEITVRRAFLYYALRRLGLDTSPNARRPQDQQIVLLNQDEIKWHAGSGKL
jgi:hypothetical protein